MRIRRILSASLLIAALAVGTAACGSADAGENKPAMQETSTPSDSMSDGAGGDRISNDESVSISLSFNLQKIQSLIIMPPFLNIFSDILY